MPAPSDGVFYRKASPEHPPYVDEGSEVIQAVVLPQAQIGRHCRITRAIIDKRCVIPDGTVIGENHDEDRKRFYVTRRGIVLVTPDMLTRLSPQERARGKVSALQVGQYAR